MKALTTQFLTFVLLAMVPQLACSGDKQHNARIAGDVADIARDVCVLLVDLDTHETIDTVCSQAEPLWPIVETVAAAIPDPKAAKARTLAVNHDGRSHLLTPDAVKRVYAAADVQPEQDQ